MTSRTLLAAALAVAVGVAGCAADGPGDGSGPGGAGASSGAAAGGSSGDTGSVTAQLTLPAGQAVQTVQWAVTGPGGAATVVQSGSVPVQNRQSVRFQVSRIPSGTAYRMSMSATAIDGSVTCSGSASFDVASRATTPVSVLMACNVATSGSQVTLVSGTSFDCAAVGSVSAIPAETSVGGHIALSASASAPVASALTYAWSASSGTIGQPGASSTTFTCTAPGVVSVTVTAADGPVPAGFACNASLGSRTINVTCDAAQDGGAPDAGGDGGDAGGPPPPPVPALPGRGTGALLGAVLLGAGCVAAGRRRSKGTPRGA